MDEGYLKHLLEIEYEHSQRAIDKFDEYRARLKGWMITASAGVATVGFTVRNPAIFWAGALMILFFGLSEMYYIDIQEDAITRNRELERLLDRLLKSGTLFKISYCGSVRIQSGHLRNLVTRHRG